MEPSVPELTQAPPPWLTSLWEGLSKRTGGQEWRERARALYRLYKRDMQDARDRREELYPETHGQHVQRTIPFVHRLARETATLYRRSPARRFEVARDDVGRTRVFEGADAATTARIERIYRGARVDAKLREAQRVAVATGNAVILVFPREDLRGVRLLVVPAHENDVQTVDALDESERDVVAWWARLPLKRDPSLGTLTSGVAVMTPTEAYWHSGPVGYSGAGLWREDRANPIGEVPAIVVRAQEPEPGLFWAAVPEDQLDAQRAVNDGWTDIGHIARMQGWGQGWIRGMTQEQAKKVQSGPETWIGLPDEAAEMGFAAPNPDLAGNQSQLEGYLGTVWAQQGLNPESVMRSRGITALAKQVERVDREHEREDWILEFDAVEQRIYRLIRLWIGAVGGLQLPEARVVVEYREATQPVDPLHTEQARALSYAHGTSSPARDLSREMGITYDEALVLVRQHRAEIVELGISPSTTPPANDGMDSNGGGLRLAGGGA